MGGGRGAVVLGACRSSSHLSPSFSSWQSKLPGGACLTSTTTTMHLKWLLSCFMVLPRCFSCHVHPLQHRDPCPTIRALAQVKETHTAPLVPQYIQYIFINILPDSAPYTSFHFSVQLQVHRYPQSRGHSYAVLDGQGQYKRLFFQLQHYNGASRYGNIFI